MQLSPVDACRPFSDAPLRRTYCEVYCLALTFVFHAENSHGRKLATLLVVGAWAAIEVGAAFEYATLPEQFYFLRLVVGIVVGRMWGIEINNFAGLEFEYGATTNEDAEQNEDNGDD